ncbi:class I tRNA ligase family protein [Candidatus Gracilibacteria bacterium]|nr:class I tRNA ligase family protein [Candidatus Gracilibacteria bacterium]
MKDQSFAPVTTKQSFPELEHEILAFWEKENIFEKSVKNRKGKPKFVFFDGPPFANGLPHYGHILASSLKDAVTRYWTMKGYYVPRVNGWDCHGLPVEYEIEKELKLSGRKDIEKMGVEVFNNACRESVFRYTKDWQVMLRRIARWVDFEQEYATLQNDYMESIWWVFSEIWKKGLVYQGHKPMHICPRCETSLSNFEVTLGYKEVNDLSVTVKFELEDEPGSYVVAWTTTPWSLLSVTGLAIGPDFDYVKVELEGAHYYIAENRLAVTFDGLGDYKIVGKIKGKELAGKRYKHVFDFYNDSPEIKASKNAFHIVGTDYVSVDDGTGIVTINGAFGEIDFEAAKKHELPIIVNVNSDGTFTKETGSYAGMYVKDAEKIIAKELAEKGLLLRKDPIRHSYPHCWRCDTPLLNYATRSWFIKVTDIKDKLLKNNKKIHWVPSHIQDGRFGKWLEGARDWNISRNRFWGCPIPIWQCECGKQVCISSLKELQSYTRVRTTLHTLRHGEAENNVNKILNSDVAVPIHLTEKGKKEVIDAAKKLKKAELSVIVCSPFMRTRETAELIAKELGVTAEIVVDERLSEHNMGSFTGVEVDQYLEQFDDTQERYWKHVGGSESFHDMEKRVHQAVNDAIKKHPGKEILFVTHGDVVRAIARYAKGLTIDETFKFKPAYAEVTTHEFGELPLRDEHLDLHKPYIDNVILGCPDCGKNMLRISEVMDCWFESGAMPYAQLHYPFENKKEFENNFPANFIAEGLDQTRGWFYTLHVISTMLFNEPAFKNIIVNGILLAADGEKLSKRKKNYPDPSVLFETHGVDTTRLFLYTSTAPLAEDVRFSEKHVEELVKKFTLTLWNAYSFFITYANIDGWKPEKEKKGKIENKLDAWILSELNTLIKEMTEQMDGYNLSRATRPLIGFVDALSNWYVRRSRRRFWKSENDGDKDSAYQTLYTVLVTVSKLIAPFMPFIADSLYKNLTGETSVHLTDWPEFDKKAINEPLNKEIAYVRTIVSLALRLRSKQLIKVRQPLQRLSIALPRSIPRNVIESHQDVILEEINVKELFFASEGELGEMTISPDARKIGPRFGKTTQEIIQACKAGNCRVEPDGSVVVPKSGAAQYTLSADEVVVGYKGAEGMEVASESGMVVALSTVVTPELQAEGWVRDIVRYTQELRKKAAYDISDRISVFIHGDKEINDAVTLFSEFIKDETLANELQDKGSFDWDKEEKVEVDGHEVTIAIRK